MFLIFATKPLNDRTSGFRFNVLGQKGLVRRRKVKSKQWSVSVGDCMARVDMGKVSLYLESKSTIRVLRHFAG
jgi:hypothetical protein